MDGRRPWWIWFLFAIDFIQAGSSLAFCRIPSHLHMDSSFFQLFILFIQDPIKM